MSNRPYASGAAQARRDLPPTSGEKDLLLRLDAWCRQNGLPTTGNRAIADAALRDMEYVHRWRDVSITSPPESPGVQPLGPDPRRWPPTARYRVAELERDGLGRRSALRTVRAAQQAPTRRERDQAASGGAPDATIRRRRAGRSRRTKAATGRPVSPRSASEIG